MEDIMADKESIREDFNTRMLRKRDAAVERLAKAHERFLNDPKDTDAYNAYRKAHKDLANVKKAFDNPPWTPLLRALISGDLAAVIKHSDNGRAIPDLNREGVALLMQPAYAGDEKIVDYLLSKGADPNIGNSIEGLSALSMAAMKDNVSIFKKLLQAGADPDIRTTAGDTLINLATYNGSEGVLKVLNSKSTMARLTGAQQKKPGQTSPPTP
jgi:ankyrin repeat protein